MSDSGAGLKRRSFPTESSECVGMAHSRELPFRTARMFCGCVLALRFSILIFPLAVFPCSSFFIFFLPVYIFISLCITKITYRQRTPRCALPFRKLRVNIEFAYETSSTDVFMVRRAGRRGRARKIERTHAFPTVTALNWLKRP